MTVIRYLRVSSVKQSIVHQKYEINQVCFEEQLYH
jgi:hypothetical protein